MAGHSSAGSGTVDPAIDRLIEQGLERYGSGDLEGALVAWEGALALSPDEPRALGYVEYVRANYTLLTGGAAATSELAVPFGLAVLEDEAAYDVEIAGSQTDSASPGPWRPTGSGELVLPPLDMHVSTQAQATAFVDDGWFLGDAAALPPVARPLPLPAGSPTLDLTGQVAPGSPTLDLSRLDAAEPVAPVEVVEPDSDSLLSPSWSGPPPPASAPDAIELEADEPDPSVATFGDDDKTRDIGARRAVTADFVAPGIDEFGDPEDTGDRERTREVRGLRSRGFVRPTADSTPVPPGGVSGFDSDFAGFGRALPGMAWASAEDSTVELRVRVRDAGAELRDTGSAQPVPLRTDLGTGDATGAAGSDAGDALDDDSEASSISTASTGPGAASEPGADDELTIERGSWARASSEHERTRERRPMPSVSSLAFDIDDDGDPDGDIEAPLVIVEDPVLADASTYSTTTPSGRRGPEPGTAGSEPDDSDEFDAAATVDRGRALSSLGLSLVGRSDAVPVQVVARDLLFELDRGAPGGESDDDRTRRRITGLLERAAAASRAGHYSSAVVAVDLALAEDPDSAVAQKLIHRSRDAILTVYQDFLGSLTSRPVLAVPMHDLAAEELDSRSAFLLSRVDGSLTFDEILDVAGMTRLEAFRYLARLLLRGILEVR